MLIGKDWKIETSDPLNAVLYRKRKGINRKTGELAKEDSWELVGYYSTPKNALKTLVDREVISDLKDFKTIVAKQDELYKLIANVK
jgi:hypothetical protein